MNIEEFRTMCRLSDNHDFDTTVTLTKRQLRWLVMERFSTAEFIFGVMLGSLAGLFIGVAIGAHMR